jgi:ribonuclease D
MRARPGPPGLPCTTAQALASQYQAIMTPASQQLNADMAAYAANDRHHLAAAEAALTADVTAQNALDASLAGLKFPPAIAPLAQALIRAGQARATLITEQARSSTLTQLRSFNRQVRLASAAIQIQLNHIVKALHSSPQTG